MSARTFARPTVAIIGGGFSGAAAAYHLAGALPRRAAEIVVVEPRPVLGQGLAYSTTDPAHRINVPAARMSLRTDTPSHFVDWLSRPDGPWMSAGTATLRGDLFPERIIFGSYVADNLRPLLETGSITHVRAAAIAAEPRGLRYKIVLSDGGDLHADALVIATTHPPPRIPAELRAVAEAAGFVADPFDRRRIEAIGPSDRVLVIGAGLTSADVIASLDRRGHYGRIVALSRRGLRSRGHGPAQAETSADFASSPSSTVRALLLHIRSALQEDARAGLTWHAAFDRLRTQGPAIWAGLDPAERRKLVARLRCMWDVHRFRIAPQVEAVIERRLQARSLRFVAGGIVGASQQGGRIGVSWRLRREPAHETELFDAVVLATGPAHGDIFSSNPLIASLGREGLLLPDPLGLGLDVDGAARARSFPRSRVGGPILVCGPLARGAVGELMGLPEVTAHAELVARELAAWAAARSETVLSKVS